MGVHAPRAPVTAHDVHVPVQGPLQQTPCWHAPDRHSAGLVQSMPFGRLLHAPPVHTFAPLQSAFVEHVVRHWPVVPHTYGSHGCCTPAVQTPAPSQRPASVATEPAQVGAMHVVPAAYDRQAPLPSQNPSVPQVAAIASAHWPSGS
jgi:hypothetical protein